MTPERPDGAARRDPVTHDRVAALPKAELHVHLDGSLRPQTMIELARERDVTLPAVTPASLAGHMLVSDAASLEQYLERFALTLSVLQDAEALERVSYELALDHAADGVRWVEVRFCPLLNTAAGLSPAQALGAAIRGLRRAELEAPIRAGVIVCALRSLDPADSTRMAELAVDFRAEGVCGFDLAGAEAGYPVRAHAAAFERAAAAGVPITIHAGEGFGPGSIRQALEEGRALRIGHGTRLHEDPALLEEVKRRAIPLEVCLTSNVQTRVVTALADHPARSYREAGVPVVLGTDNRLMSGVTLSREYLNAHEALGWAWSDLVDVARAGFAHAFTDDDTRAELLNGFEAEVATLG